MRKMPFSSAKDRRSTPRFACEMPAECRPLSDFVEDIRWSARIKDISRGGVKLLAARRFERGTVLNIDPEQASSIGMVIARVIHVSPDEKGGWNLGCHFPRKISTLEVAQFLSKAPQATE